MYVHRADVESHLTPYLPAVSPAPPPAPTGGNTGLPKDTIDFGQVGNTGVVDPPSAGTIGGSVDPTPLPKPVDGTAPTTSAPPAETAPGLTIPAENAKTVRRRMNKELRALRIAVRRQLKQRFGDRLKNDPAMKAKVNELVRDFQNRLRTSFEEAGGKGIGEFDGNALLAGLNQAFGALSDGLSQSMNPNQTSAPTSTGTSPLPSVDSDPALAGMTSLFDQRYQRIEAYLSSQAFAMSAAQASLVTRRSIVAPAVNSPGAGLNIAV